MNAVRVLPVMEKLAREAMPRLTQTEFDMAHEAIAAVRELIEADAALDKAADDLHAYLQAASLQDAVLSIASGEYDAAYNTAYERRRAALARVGVPACNVEPTVV